MSQCNTAQHVGAEVHRARRRDCSGLSCRGRRELRAASVTISGERQSRVQEATHLEELVMPGVSIGYTRGEEVGPLKVAKVLAAESHLRSHEQHAAVPDINEHARCRIGLAH